MHEFARYGLRAVIVGEATNPGPPCIGCGATLQTSRAQPAFSCMWCEQPACRGGWMYSCSTCGSETCGRCANQQWAGEGGEQTDNERGEPLYSPTSPADDAPCQRVAGISDDALCALVASSGSEDGDACPGTLNNTELVLGAARAVHQAADKCGHVALDGEVPSWLRIHRCPQLLSPLVWEALRDESVEPVRAWFASAAATADRRITSDDFTLSAEEAVNEVFAALRSTFRELQLDADALAERLRGNKRRARPGQRLGASAVRDTGIGG